MSKQSWAVDVAHSSIDFSIRHMMVSNVKGNFPTFTASIAADPTDLTSADIQISVELNSINTRNKDRDAHLRTSDFFEVEKYPQMVFKATKIVKTDEGEYDVTGDLSIHGITRPEKFAVIFEGTGKDPYGNEKVGFSATGAIKRSDYGLTYNAALETGGFLVGDLVKISIDIEAGKQA